jgi:Helix-turn-helix domain
VRAVIDPNRIAEVRRVLGRQLAEYRQAAGLNQHQFAPLTHYGRSTVANVEVGRQNVPRTFWERADAALGTGGSLTAQYDELMLLVREQRRESAIGRAVHPVGFGEQEVNPVPTRREVFGYVGAGLTAAGLDEFITGRRAGLPRVVHALEITRHAQVSDRMALENLNTVTEHYKRTFRSTPPAELYNEVLGVRAHAGALLDDTSAVKSVESRRELVVSVGWLSNLLALVTHDLGDRAASLVWCADAERRSHEARYPELAGWAAQTRVLMSFYDGQAAQAIAHAQRGQRLAPIGTVAHAKLRAHEMRAWALLGNADKVASTRRCAGAAIAKLPPNTPTQGSFSISLADDPPYTATSLLLLGRYEEAVAATRRVIAAFYGSRAGEDGEGRTRHPSGYARTHLILALAMAGIGRLDEAYAAATTALQAPCLTLTWPVAVLAGKLDRMLMRDCAGATQARSYHELYRVFLGGQPLQS